MVVGLVLEPTLEKNIQGWLMKIQINAATRLVASQQIQAKSETRVIGEYVTEDEHHAITIQQVINTGSGKVYYKHDQVHDKFSPTFMHAENYHDVYKTVNEYLKGKRGWKAITPLPEHEPSTHVEPSGYSFHVEFLDEHGKTGKLDHDVKAHSRLEAFTELLKGLKRSGGMAVR